jgi:hypothetical protein
MPNGGSDCRENVGSMERTRVRQATRMRATPNQRFTRSALLPIENPFYIYCGYHRSAVPNGIAFQLDRCSRETRPERGRFGSPPRTPKRFANTCFSYSMLRSNSRRLSTLLVCTPTRSGVATWRVPRGSSHRQFTAVRGLRLFGCGIGSVWP